MKQKYLYLIIWALLAFIMVLIHWNYQQQSVIENPKNHVLLRKIGHELLKRSNDTISKVLPIKMISANEFQIQFENEFSLQPDALVSIVQSNLNKSTFPKDYAVNVLECSSQKVVYGFVISSNAKEDIVPCLKRNLPVGCYIISLQFSTKMNFISSNASIFWSGAVLLLLGLLFVIFYRKKSKSWSKSESHNDIQIGKYIFHHKQHCVEFEGFKIPLTVKESKLLYIFFTSPNVIIDRNVLQKEVWENEGIIVTRSLDMFISKLRKKLDKDGSVNIVNIHGIGYKLEVL